MHPLDPLVWLEPRWVPLLIHPHGCGSKPMGSHFGVGAPPILEPILVGIGMFTGGVRGFDPWPHANELGGFEAPAQIFFSDEEGAHFALLVRHVQHFVVPSTGCRHVWVRIFLGGTLFWSFFCFLFYRERNTSMFRVGLF